MYIIKCALWKMKNQNRIWVIGGGRWISYNVIQAGQEKPHEETFSQRFEEGEGVSHTKIWERASNHPVLYLGLYPNNSSNKKH